ncbi:hypothetical protein ACOSQ2_017373 [Xanthoceras sorbifolium]
MRVKCGFNVNPQIARIENESGFTFASSSLQASLFTISNKKKRPLFSAAALLKIISSLLLCFSKLLSPLRSSLLSCRVDVAPLPSPVAAFGKTSHGFLETQKNFF